MISYRRACLSVACVCLCALVSMSRAQTPPAAPQTPATPQTPAPAQPQPAPAQQKKPENPFESVPEAPPQNKPGEAPQQPPLETPKPAEQPKTQPGGKVIEAIIFTGARRVPQDTLRALIATKKGDIYNEDELHRDFMALWNSGRFDDIRMETRAGHERRRNRPFRGHRTPRGALHQLRGHQIHHRFGNPGPVQRAQSGSVGRIAIRSRTRSSAPPW